jgi:hypothetical protein
LRSFVPIATCVKIAMLSSPYNCSGIAFTTQT